MMIALTRFSRKHTVVLASWVAASLAGLGLLGIESTGAPIQDRQVPPVTFRAEDLDTPLPNSRGEDGTIAADMESGVALPDPHSMLPTPTPPVLVTSVSTADVQNNANSANPVATLYECIVPEICIDEYLWSLYQRTPKVDTNKVLERIKVPVQKKGKPRTVVKTITKYVEGDFTWKERALSGMITGSRSQAATRLRATAHIMAVAAAAAMATGLRPTS
jgi:hypothetical protein